MAADLRIKIQSAAVVDAMNRVRLALPLQGDMTPANRSVARVLKTGTQLRFRKQVDPDGSPWKKARRGGQTLSLSKLLRNSITSAFDQRSAAVGTNVAYAAIHQFGGVIRAKKGPFLAIPVTPEAREEGSPKNMPGLSVWQTIKGQYVMGKDGVVHFLLRRQVTMPERPFLGVSSEDKTELLRVLQTHFDGIWRR